MSKKTKYFLDTEFIENGSTIDLISIGIVCEDGRTYYAQNLKCDFTKASDWVWRNVFPHLLHFDMRGVRGCMGMPAIGTLSNARQSKCGNAEQPCPWRERYEIRNEVLEFMDVEKHGKPEVWGYYADYDWVAFCQLFGTMMELPKGFPMYCRDIKQWADMLGNPPLPKPEVEIHHALVDAQGVQEMHEFLKKYSTITIP